jgi:hypothetical protein
VALGLTALAVDPGPAFRQLLAPSAYSHNQGLRYGFTTVFGARGSRLTRPAELAVMPLVALRLRFSRSELLSFAIVGALLLRPLTEPILFPYYLAPFAGVMVVLIAAGNARDGGTLGLLLPIALTVWSPRMDLPGALWWPVAILVLAMTVGLARRGIAVLLPGHATCSLPAAHPVPVGHHSEG